MVFQGKLQFLTASKRPTEPGRISKPFSLSGDTSSLEDLLDEQQIARSLLPLCGEASRSRFDLSSQQANSSKRELFFGGNVKDKLRRSK